MELLTRLRLNLDHLTEDRYNDKFATYLFRSEVESASHFLWHCHYHISKGILLFDELKAFGSGVWIINDNKLAKTVLYDSSIFKANQNTSILNFPFEFFLLVP